MKTYEQLMKHYWGVIVPMAKAAGINPWECVRYGDMKPGTTIENSENIITEFIQATAVMDMLIERKLIPQLSHQQIGSIYAEKQKAVLKYMAYDIGTIS